jgi:hypothetical protein
MFASNLRKLGGKVHVVVWKESEHVGMTGWPEIVAELHHGHKIKQMKCSGFF